jgi:3-methyladenine DNA glycosylase AlkD
MREHAVPSRTARKNPALKEAVQEALAALERLATKKVREDMPRRYGIFTKKAFGVKVGDIQRVARGIGKSHELALALWDTGWYEARMLAAYIDEPARLTPAQMDRWCRDFDNWAIVDTVCFKLFDRVAPDLAFRKVERWSRRRQEFARRAAFALLASLALHDKESGDEPFARCLPLIERAAADDRNFVRKGVSWALRSIGRRSPSLRAVAVALAKRLAASTGDNAPAARWLGNDALRDLGRRG